MTQRTVTLQKPDLLRVQIVALTFEPGPTANGTFTAARQIDPAALCVAVLKDDQCRQVRADWQDDETGRLHIIHQMSLDPVDVAIRVIQLQPKGPLALLMANFPPAGLLAARSRAETVRRLTSARPDIQLLPYDPNWKVRLPRIV